MRVDKKVTVGYDRVMENLPNLKVLTLKDIKIQCGKNSSKDHYKVTQENKKPLAYFNNFLYFLGMGV